MNADRLRELDENPDAATPGEMLLSVLVAAIVLAGCWTLIVLAVMAAAKAVGRVFG